MVAFLVEGDGSVVREIECHDEPGASHRACALHLTRVVHCPITDDDPRYVVYLSTDGRRILIFGKHQRSGDHTTAVRELIHWIRSHGATAAYPVLTQRRLPPTPNGGSHNTPDRIRSWVDSQIDAFTLYHIRCLGKS